MSNINNGEPTGHHRIHRILNTTSNQIGRQSHRGQQGTEYRSSSNKYHRITNESRVPPELVNTENIDYWMWDWFRMSVRIDRPSATIDWINKSVGITDREYQSTTGPSSSAGTGGHRYRLPNRFINSRRGHRDHRNRRRDGLHHITERQSGIPSIASIKYWWNGNVRMSTTTIPTMRIVVIINSSNVIKYWFSGHRNGQMGINVIYRSNEWEYRMYRSE